MPEKYVVAELCSVNPSDAWQPACGLRNFELAPACFYCRKPWARSLRLNVILKWKVSFGSASNAQKPGD